jgi:hypothetical protein
MAENEVYVGRISLDELLITLRSFKIREAPATDNMNVELIKQAQLSYILKFFRILGNCLETASPPNE